MWADELTQIVVGGEGAGTGRCGSQAAAVIEDWVEDSVVIDIGDDATDWGGRKDADAVEKQIADGVVADSLEGGTDSGFEGSMFGFISGVDRFDSTGWDYDFDADAVGRFIATELDAAGLSLLAGGGSGDLVVEGDSEDLLFAGGSERTVRLDPLIVAERQLIKGELQDGCKKLIDSCAQVSALGLLVGSATGGSEISFIYDEKTRLMEHDVDDREYQMEKLGSDDIVAHFGRAVGSISLKDLSRYVQSYSEGYCL